MGVIVADVSDAKKKELNIKGGVEVTGLGDGPLARAGARPGDVIIRVADTDISGVKQFEALVKGLDPNKAVAVFIRRADSTLVVPVRPK
jgi:serine protease Do